MVDNCSKYCNSLILVLPINCTGGLWPLLSPLAGSACRSSLGGRFFARGLCFMG
jgi:hypothetical protein